jgi:hypothetical protein
MPPMIMYRVSFDRKDCAQNDNQAGHQIVMPRTSRQGRIDTESTQQDRALSSFFGSHLPHLRSDARGETAQQVIARHVMAQQGRRRLAVIEGGAMATNAGGVAERERCR